MLLGFATKLQLFCGITPASAFLFPFLVESQLELRVLALASESEIRLESSLLAQSESEIRLESSLLAQSESEIRLLALASESEIRLLALASESEIRLESYGRGFCAGDHKGRPYRGAGA